MDAVVAFVAAMRRRPTMPPDALRTSIIAALGELTAEHLGALWSAVDVLRRK